MNDTRFYMQVFCSTILRFYLYRKEKVALARGEEKMRIKGVVKLEQKRRVHNMMQSKHEPRGEGNFENSNQTFSMRYKS